MTDPRTLHDEAMEHADRALLLRRSGAEREARELFRLAFEKEVAAAQFYRGDLNTEPTRSVLYRSAASLALDYGNYRAAERLLATALIGDPPDPIAGEIRDLMEMVHFQRHLDLRGIHLRPDEFQFSIDGFGTGFGIAPADQFVGRVHDVETMIYRTAERKLQQPFRDSIRRRKAFGDLRLYVSVPRAASFAVTLRIGASDQLELPDMPGANFPIEVVREVLDCVALVNQRQFDELEKRIPDESYFRNFIGLTQKIAPDGEVVRAVGFTAAADGVERRVALTTPKALIEPPLRKLPELVAALASAVVEVQGTLLEADATDEKLGQIKLKTPDGTMETISVPRGMMRDIVRPLFEEEVIVNGIQSRGRIELRSVRRVDE